jgi:tripartite-type tricarboxylate transporter receptor subunit TctC
MRKLLWAAAVGLAASCGSAAWAAEYPSKPIELMVAYGAGGSTDVGARIIASIAEKILGQPIVVSNRPGAGGQVGWTEFSRERPDGYHIAYINLPALHTVILDPERKAIFDKDSFTPIINQVLDPGLIWVKADSPYKSLADLIEAARKNPDTITACTTGILSDDHLELMMLEEAAGVKFRTVHFNGGAEQMTGILGGHVDVAFDNVGSVVKRVKSGEVRGLVVMDTERSKFLPDVPTTPESGYPKVISSSTRGIAGPKGMKPEVVKKLADAFAKAMADPEHVNKMEASGLAIKVMTGKEYQAYYDENHRIAAKYP